VPLEPLPEGWGEGQELEIPRDAAQGSAQETADDDARWAAIEQAASEITIDDFRQMQAALEEADRQAKDWMRRSMGLA
jgi:biopolymer transport protein ExbB/TolQ